MLTGKRFRLKQATLGIQSVEGQRTAVLIPADDVVLVVSGPRPDDKRMVDVEWVNRRFVVFADDLIDRGEEVNASASGT